MSRTASIFPMPVLVSSCLLGKPVRYDGRDALRIHPTLERWRQEGRLRLLCPEMAGGLPVPRPAVEIEPGKRAEQVLLGQAKVQDASGNDMSDSFRLGAQLAVELVQAEGIKVAMLKEGSPSCGSSLVADGFFAGRRIAGKGVTATALEAIGVKVYSENELEQAQAYLQSIEAKLASED